MARTITLDDERADYDDSSQHADNDTLTMTPAISQRTRRKATVP
jgi:hypothetical protein